MYIVRLCHLKILRKGESQRGGVPDFGLELMKETRPWGKNWRYADMNENNSLILILGYDEKDCCYASMEVPELV